MSRKPHDQDPLENTPESESPEAGTPEGRVDPPEAGADGQEVDSSSDSGMSRRKMLAMSAWGAGLFAYAVPRVAMARADAETTPDNSNVKPVPDAPRVQIGAERLAEARESLLRFTSALQGGNVGVALEEVSDNYWDGARKKEGLGRDLQETVESIADMRIEPGELIGLGDDGRQIYVEFEALTTGVSTRDGKGVSITDKVEAAMSGERLQISCLSSVQTFN